MTCLICKDRMTTDVENKRGVCGRCDQERSHFPITMIGDELHADRQRETIERLTRRRK